MGEKKTIEFAVKALILKEGKFLALHKANITSDEYELPGGRMEFGETAEQTLVREVYEETGLNVTPIKLIDTWNYIADESLQITGIIYLCRVTSPGEIVLSYEHTAYQWLAPDADSLRSTNRLFAPQMQRWDWACLMQ